MVLRSKTPIRNLSYTMVTDFKYDWSMIGPSNKDCLVTSNQSVANLYQLGRRATSDKDDHGFCVYHVHDAESRVELSSLFCNDVMETV